jgi:hypothetical protein
MTTIHHPVRHHTGPYVAAAAIVLAGLVAALVTVVLSTSVGSDRTPPAVHPKPIAMRHFPGPTFREVCFAHRPVQSIDLVGPGCIVR